MLVFVSCNSPFLSIPSYCRGLASQSIIVSTIAPKIVATGYYILQENVPIHAEDLPGFSTPIMDFYYRAGACVGLCEVDRGG